MSAGIAPQTNNQVEQERQRVGRLLDEVARLTEAEVPAAGFFGEMLKRLLEALQAPAGAVWMRSAQGIIQLTCHINLKLSGHDKNEKARAMHEALLGQAFAQPKPQVVPPNSGQGEAVEGQVPPGNPSDYVLLLVPIVQDGQVEGVIEVWQNPNRPSNTFAGFLHYMGLMAELCGRYLRHQRMTKLTSQQQLWSQLEVFARQIHGSLNPIEVAYQVANEGRRLIECDRVSVGVRYGRGCSIDAISGADIVEKRSNLVVLMRKLCDQVIKWGEKLVYQGVKDDSLPPKVLKALDEYLAESSSRMLVIYPLHDERDGTEKKKPARSALVMESFEAPVEPEQLMARGEIVARHSSPALYNAVEHRRIPMRFLWLPLAKIQEGLGGKVKAIMVLVAVALTMLISVLILVPYPLKMESTGQLLPQIRQVIYSPTVGKVNEFFVLPSEDVVENRVLAQMSDIELETRLRKLKAEINAAKAEVDAQAAREKQYQLPQDERLKGLSQQQQKRQELRSKQAELDALIARTGADPQRLGYFYLKAPQLTPEQSRMVAEVRHGNHKKEWTVLNGNFKEEWTLREAKPSDPLLRLGVKDGPWEIELKIPQKHIGQVKKAMEELRKKNPGKVPVLDVDFLLRTDPTRVFKGKLYDNKIAPEAVPNKEESAEAEPVVLATVSIDDEGINPADRLPPALLLSGSEVHAKVRCGDRPMYYSLFYGVWEFLYEKVVFFFF
jgi:hypothetical protein